MDAERRSRLETVFWFLLANLSFSVFTGYCFLLSAPAPKGAVAGGFLHIALLSTVFLVYLAFAGLMSFVAVTTTGTAVLFPVLVGSLSLLHVVTLVDLTVFRIFRYHIDPMVVALLSSEGSGDSVHLGTGTLLTAFLLTGAIVAAETVLVRFCHARMRGLPILRKAARACLALSIAFILADKVGYAVANLSGDRDVVRSTRVIPLYRGPDAGRILSRLAGRERAARPRPPIRAATLPPDRLEREPVGRLPNILWILIDSWRADMLSPETTPNIASFAENALVFRNHFSGGNCTRFGVFSLLYGVYGSYWRPYLKEGRSPVLLDELQKLGYDFRILSSTRLSYPEFRRTAFVNLLPYVEDTLPGENAAQRDPELARAFVRWLDGRAAGAPFFAFLFFDAPHNPPSYPPGFARHTPIADRPNYITTGPGDRVPLFNAYRNAIRFDDSLVGWILGEIRKRGMDRESVILITGDHGEEFYEMGYWGHTSAFNRYQTQVPLVLSIPGVGPGEVTRRSSHLDVAPTMLELVGYTTPPEAYSQGRSLLEGRGSEFLVQAGWRELAIVDGDHVIVVPLDPEDTWGTEVRSARDYRIVPDEEAVLRRKRDAIAFAMEGTRTFLARPVITAQRGGAGR